MRFLPPASVLHTLLVAPVWAAEFQVTPTLGLAQYYSDNVNLAPPGQERSDWVTAVRPGVSFNYHGAKLNFNASYTLEMLYRASESNVDVNQQYTGGTTGSMEIVPQFLFFDTNSTVSQYNTTVTGPLATSNINTAGNRASVRTTSLTPYIRYRFDTEALAEVRYSYSIVNSSDSATINATESTGGNLNALLTSGPGYKLTGWSLAYHREKVDYTLGREYTLQNFSATVRRLITPVFGVSASAGYEDNNYATLTGEQPKGVTWNVGLNWTPTPRTNLTATLGERFYGRTYGLDFNHRMRRLFLGAGYNEEITTTRSQFVRPVLSDTATYLDTLLLSQIPDPVARQEAVRQEIARLGLPSTLSVPVNFFTDQVFLQKAWRASAGLQGPLHTFLGNFFTSSREQQTPGLSAGVGDFATSTRIDQYGGSLSWSWRITPFTSSNVSLNYAHTDYPDVTRGDTTKYVRATLNTQLGAKTAGSLSYQRLQSDSNAAAANYQENQFVAQVLTRF